MNEQKELPVGWVETTLGEVRIDLSTGIVPGNFPEQLFELYSVPSFDIQRPEIVRGKEIGSNKQVVEIGTVLLCKINPRINRAWVIGSYSNFTKIASTEWIPFFEVEGLVPSYLCYFLSSNTVRDYLAAHASGVGGSLMRINPNTISKYPFPLAPTNEQHRIVAAIEQQFTRLDAAVASLKQAQKKLKLYRSAILKAAVEGKLTQDWRAQHPTTEPAPTLLQRILHERRAKWEADQLAKMAAKGITPKDNKWKEKYQEPAQPDIEDLPTLPEGWCWATVEQIAQIQGGIQKQPSRAPRNNAFPYLRVANVFRGRLDLTHIEKMELFGDELNTLRLEAGDLLIVEGNGSRTEIGRSALWKGEIPDCVHQNHIIRVRLRKVNPQYLDFYWNSPDGNERVMNVAASTSGLYTLSVGKIAKIPCPLPPLAEQEQIVAFVEEQLSIISELETTVEHNLKRAERERQSILREAFAGRLVPQDPRDEPASVLLERIREEGKRREEEERKAKKGKGKVVQRVLLEAN